MTATTTSALTQGSSPLSPEQHQLVLELASTLTPTQKVWLSGYLAGSAETAGGAPGAPPASAAEPATLTVLYGSQTGNAKHVAGDLAAAASARGLTVALTDMADYKPNQLKNEKFVAVVVSTHGEGDPPESAEKLHTFLASKKAPDLSGAQVSVLGLGDSSYEFYCQAAVDFEDRLRSLGASVVSERLLLDVDYEDQIPGWVETTLDVFEPELNAVTPAGGTVVQLPGLAATAPTAYSKRNPFVAEVGEVQKITGRDSTKDVRHVEILLEGSGLAYQPGDSLGVFFSNDPGSVDSLLEALGLDGAQEITLGGQDKPLREALLEDLELTQSYPGFVEKYAAAAATPVPALAELGEDKAALRSFLETRQIYDIVHQHPAQVTAQQLVDSLRKQQPRLYSIASSQQEVEDEVHLTVGVIEWRDFGREHVGGCSGFVRRAEEGDSVRVFVEPNDHFRLPADPGAATIMIGPGTGIAPFRAFLQERDAQGADGDNWLIFGNPHFTQDFLYQVEFQGYLRSGLLTRMDVAFSRDQAEKVYVQHRIRQHGAEVFSWLEQGAHLYVCGDANRMAKDVHAALVEVVAEHGRMDADAAEDYLATLRDGKRYQRDVY
ncbi:assimilatory sulfite reductase (NADPH) flavoprotein subunit [Serinicoccus kebangsaanensis]|uniref:assimilatory sulfite reductase (NADPH) flavoprotein subunit n=1 Tax=Serinicoccus kebangsaanensis TaxID=2602069 RepID=UPI00124BFE02|nr:assimilatory sulfite reductase (NADPH) flavoprotein subunit [Serinicoccus kebangsaanensis]